ncbi:MAG: hypothetical protein WCG25_01065 [bacterium]
MIVSHTLKPLIKEIFSPKRSIATLDLYCLSEFSSNTKSNFGVCFSHT